MRVIYSGFIVFFVSFGVNHGVSFEPLAPIEGWVDDIAYNIRNELVDEVRNLSYKIATVSEDILDTSQLGNIRKNIYELRRAFATHNENFRREISELAFYLVTAENLENPKKIDHEELEDLALAKGKLFFFLHGWRVNLTTPWYYDLSKILIQRQIDTRVVQVNWNLLASENYMSSSLYTESVGNTLGTLLSRLVKDYKVPADNIILIGHSLGAHIAGFAGKKYIEDTGMKLPRIIALDPAGPIFTLLQHSKRLNRKDAEVVMVVHTNAGLMGYPTKVGTIDFYPNGGFNQPGCNKVLEKAVFKTYLKPLVCDHIRAWELFTEAVQVTDSFPARKCKSYESFQKGICRGIVVLMGDLETNDTGSFYLNTNSRTPYSQPLFVI